MKQSPIFYRITRAAVATAVAFIALTSWQAAPNQQRLQRERPDMDAIRRDVTDPSSKYYYPKLIKAFQSNDTTMTLDQFRHLYLGYIFQEDYDPYRRSPYSSKVEELYLRDKHTHQECDTMIHYAELSLKDDPFDLRQMSFLIYAYREKKKHHSAAILQYKLNNLLKAIISTGTGLDPENAWVVNNPQHEYNLLNFQDYVVENQQDIPPYYDYITVKETGKPDGGPMGFYFDVRYVLEEYNRKYPDGE